MLSFIALEQYLHKSSKLFGLRAVLSFIALELDTPYTLEGTSLRAVLSFIALEQFYEKLDRLAV